MTAQETENLKEWLRFAVAEAEKELGSGTGQLKLRMVYDKAIEKFPFISKIPFSVFSGFVDQALDWMKDQLTNNKKIREYVNS